MAVKFDPILGQLRQDDSGSGSGDMTKAVYDPNSSNADAFNQDNMVSGTTNKNYTATIDTRLAGTSGSNTGDSAANSSSLPITGGAVSGDLSTSNGIISMNLSPANNISIPAGYGSDVAVRKLLIASGKKLTIGLGARFRIA